MDYEQKYNEALEHARAEILANPGLRKTWEEIFPELRESEDEKIRKYFVWIVKNVLDNIQGLKLSNEQTRELIENYDGIKVSDMLAYLEKQKEQMPAEWSEEDERIRKAILGFLNPDKGGTKYSSNAELVEWSNWLKSLRPQPHWKPSEEQMNLLLNIEGKLRADGKLVKATQLAELYEQLKKMP